MTNKAEKDLMDRVGSLGCIVCKIYYNVESPGHIHHLTGLKYRSIGKKAKEFICLCPTHHQNSNGEHYSIHGHPKLFAEKYGNQEFLLEYTNKFLAED